MTRFFAPLLFLAAAGYVYWFNLNHADRVLLLPFLPALKPSLEGDFKAQGELTAELLAGVGLLLLVIAAIPRRRRREES